MCAKPSSSRPKQRVSPSSQETYQQSQQSQRRLGKPHMEKLAAEGWLGLAIWLTNEQSVQVQKSSWLR